MPTYDGLLTGANSYEVPDDFFYSDPASAAWRNPYLDPSIDPNTYSRFDASVKGSGLRTSDHSLVSSFDSAFASQWTKPLQTGLSAGAENLLGSGTGFGGLGAAALGQIRANTPTPAALQKIFDANNKLSEHQNTFKELTTHPDYLEAYKQLGIDPKKLTSPQALQAIAPDTKAEVFDIVQRNRQLKNQRPPQGIGDALGGFGGFVLPALASLVAGPVGGALFGGVQGLFGAGGGLDPLGALKGAATGYGIGDVVANGFKLPDILGGQEIFGPIATNGVPAGFNPLFDSLSKIPGSGQVTTPGGNTGGVFSPQTAGQFGQLPPVPGGGTTRDGGANTSGLLEALSGVAGIASSFGQQPTASAPQQQQQSSIQGVPETAPLLQALSEGGSLPASALTFLTPTAGSGYGNDGKLSVYRNQVAQAA